MEYLRIGLKIIGVVISAYFLVGVVIHFFPEKFIFFWPNKLSLNQPFKFDQPFEEVFIDSINGLLFRGEGNPKGVVLYFHGNSGNLQRWGNYARDFTRLGYDFFAIDYPGYGKTKGIPSENALYESAQSAYDWVRERYSSDAIILYGRSLGSAPASYLSHRVEARMLILETPFYNFEDLYQKHPILSFYPLHPKSKFPVNEYIENAVIPVYIFHGTKDGIVPLASAIRLQPLLKEEGRFSIIEGARHRNLSEFEAYHLRLQSILETNSTVLKEEEL